MSYYALTVLCLILGSTTHIVKKVIEVRKTDGTFSLKKYITMYPYKTYMVAMAGVGGYLGLLASGELTVASAFLMGFTANSIGNIDASDAKE